MSVYIKLGVRLTRINLKPEKSKHDNHTPKIINRCKDKLGVRRRIAIFDLEKYQQKLEALRKNRQKVPEELLKTKYVKPYNELREELKVMTEEFLYLIMLSSIFYFKEDQGEIAETIQRTVDANQNIFASISNAVFITQDYTEIERLVVEMSSQIKEAYRPYFQRQCFKDDDGRYRSKLLNSQWNADFIWNEEYKLWEGKDNATGNLCWTAGMEPKEEV